ncbi:DMT family transporter [Candidatus Saccharibacteria bacterium]|nr:DMT family transporter [Candidatus Saccharibacteria bacterium]
MKSPKYSDGTLGVIAGVVSACFFASYLVLNRYIFKRFEVDAVGYALVFNALGGLYAGASLLRPPAMRKVRGALTDWRGMAVLCLAGFIGMLLLVVGQRYTSSIHASLLVTTSIVLTMYFSGLLLHEHVTRRQQYWVAVLFAGIYLAVVGVKSFEFQPGDAVILVAVVFFGLGNVLSRRLMRRHGAGVVPDVRLLLVGLLTAILYIGFVRSIDLFSVVGLWTALAALCYYLTMKTFAVAVHHINANHAIVIVNAQIVPASLAGVLLLGEHYTWEKLIGSAVVLTSIYYISWRARA